MLANEEETPRYQKKEKRQSGDYEISSRIVLIEASVQDDIAAGTDKIGQRIPLDDTLKDWTRSLIRIEKRGGPHQGNHEDLDHTIEIIGNHSNQRYDKSQTRRKKEQG